MPSSQTTDAGKLGSWSIRTVKPWTASAPHEANCPCVHCTLQRDSDTRPYSEENGGPRDA